ncbi:tyrosine-protein phosphatase non-receptor type 9-like [Bacillus rossius redtenbacheri]|uniref:tyrosine-protein phosphatase non-receptor type 9-like n=1 Tax=Bacillus rossius redtenbacheri TaxID=93214 RepID=UPI002FDDF28A
MSTESIQDFRKRRDDVNFWKIMESELWLINCMSFEGQNLPEEMARKGNRKSIVGNVGFDIFSTNYVDGYNIKRKFIIVNNSGSEVDSYNFWSFIWESVCKVIVRFDRTSKRRHWLNNFRDDASAVGEFIIRKKTILGKYFTQLEMTIENIMERKSRKVTHFHYHGCLDNIASVGCTQLVYFLKMVNKKQGSYLTTETEGMETTCGPIVLHSIGCLERAVSICVLDICLDQLMETSSVSVLTVILNIKSQVSFESFSLAEYRFINKTLLHSIRVLNVEDDTPTQSDPKSVSFRSRIKKHLPGYVTHRADRLAGAQGGVAILVRRTLSHHRRHMPQLHYVEAVAVRLHTNPTPFTAVALYIPPPTPFPEEDLTSLRRLDSCVILAGDFNARHTS